MAPVRIVLATGGSEGDVQPVVALAVALTAAGHSPVLLGDRCGGDLAQAAGVEFVALAGDVRAVLDAGLPRTGWAQMAALTSMARRHSGDWVRAIDAAAEGADAVLGLSLATAHAAAVAHGRGLPAVLASLQPNLPTREFAPPLAGRTDLPRWTNRLSAHTILAFVQATYAGPIRTAMRGLGRRRPSWRITADLGLGAWSPTLVRAAADWPTDAGPVTGDWPLPPDPAWTPPADLAAFLADGEPPVYVGFGSMRGLPGQNRLRENLLRGLQGRRVLLADGWAGLADGELPDGVLRLGRVPHDWLFPRCAVVVHHCGAGTTHAAARAGVPTVPIPMVADQPFWADRLRRNGIATPALALTRFGADQVRDAVRAAADLRPAAARVASAMRSERGTEAAVAALERLVTSTAGSLG